MKGLERFRYMQPIISDRAAALISRLTKQVILRHGVDGITLDMYTAWNKLVLVVPYEYRGAVIVELRKYLPREICDKMKESYEQGVQQRRKIPIPTLPRSIN